MFEIYRNNSPTGMKFKFLDHAIWHCKKFIQEDPRSMYEVKGPKKVAK